MQLVMSSFFVYTEMWIGFHVAISSSCPLFQGVEGFEFVNEL